jgi:hypothetical protein
MLILDSNNEIQDPRQLNDDADELAKDLLTVTDAMQAR